MNRWPSLERINLYTLIILACMLSITAVFVTDHLISTAPTARPARDFIAFWATSKLTLAGQPEVAYDLNKLVKVIASTVGYERKFAWLYPPTFQIFVTPFSLLPYKVAYGIFIGLSITCFYLSARKLVQTHGFALAIISFPAVYICILYGQNSLITASLAMLGIYHLDKRPLLSGFFIGLLAIKPQMAIIFPIALLAGKHWRTLLSAATTQAICIITSLYFFGTKTWLAFIASADQPRHWLESGSLSWEKMISVFALCKILGANTSIAYIVHSLVALGFIAAMIHVWRNSSDLCLRGASLILATLTTTPYAHEYEMVWLAGPLLLLSRYGLNHGWHLWQREILLLAWLTPLFNWVITAPAGQQPTPLTLFIELAMLFSIMTAMYFPKMLEKTS